MGIRLPMAVFVGTGILVCSAHAAGGFEPLDRWKAAVVAGDAVALRGFYISGSGAFAQTPAGRSQDPAAEETDFWSKLAAQGLAEINPKVLAETSKTPDAIQFVLRIEMTFRSAGAAQKSMVSAHQLWVRRDGEWRIFATGRSDLRALPAIRLPQPEVPNPHLYPSPDEAGQELTAAIGAARVDHKRVLVVFGANWCYDCQVLDATLRSPSVAPLVEANYHVLHINIGDDGDRNGDLAERFQVPLKKGIPGLAVLDSTGQLITSQKNGEFESAARIGMSDVTGFLERWKPGSKATAE
jgi:hypothetical protein